RGARTRPDRPAPRARRGLRPRPRVHREVPAVHRRRGHPPPPTHRRGRVALSADTPPGVRRVALVGSTASGKSAVAMAAARALDGVELVSIDSMQVYRGMDIGTAKPSPAE